jgi:TolB protein
MPFGFAERRAAGQTGRLLLAGVLSLLAACRPAAPALSGRVAFVSERDGNAEVYVLDLASGRSTRVTRRAQGDFPAAALPGGDVLVVSAEGDDEATHRESFWRYRSAADTLVPLRIAARTLRHPVVSPDGRVLVFEADFASFRDLYRYDLAADTLARLTDHALGNFDPSFAPDGARLVFASSREGQAEVYAMPAAGEGPGGAALQRLTAFHRDDWAPRWSPDGRRVAFLSNREGGVPRLFLVAPDGTGLRRLLGAAEALGADAQEHEAVWSPDGRFLAFEVLPRGGGAQLWVAEAATGRRWRVADALASASQPAWAPASDALVFSGHAPEGGDPELYAVRRDGTGLTRLTRSPGPDWLPLWLN